MKECNGQKRRIINDVLDKKEYSLKEVTNILIYSFSTLSLRYLVSLVRIDKTV